LGTIRLNQEEKESVVVHLSDVTRPGSAGGDMTTVYHYPGL